jgi:hypothetical protein
MNKKRKAGKQESGKAETLLRLFALSVSEAPTAGYEN